MILHKHILCVLFAITALHASAQTNGSNSSYSRFGLGTLKEQSQGFNKAMSGLSQGFREGRYINMQNPASYSATDSLSLIFDVGMSFQNANFKSGGNSINAHNTTLDYVNTAFRLNKGLGLSLGFIPYTSIGYNFTSKPNYIGDHLGSGSAMTYTNTFSGNGGIHQAYLGLGWNPVSGLSLGFNIGYLWGNYSQSMVQAFYENGTASTTINGLNKVIEADFASYKLDIGVQYPVRIDKDNLLTLGATYGLGHTMNNTAHCYEYQANNDSTTTNISKAFDLPHSISAGLAWKHKEQWTVGADVTFQKWSGCNVPQVTGDNSFIKSSDNYMDRTKIVVGGEYQPNRYSNKYLQRVQYRLGASYTTPYYKIDGKNGPREFGLSAGFALPVTKNVNNRSVVNVAFQWIKTTPGDKSLITENYLRLNIGLTFNERWFMKWKIQ